MPSGELGELAPIANRLAVGGLLDDELAAVGIVKFEDRRLGKGVGGAETGGMIGIALDLDRSPINARDQEPNGPRRRCP